MKYLQWWPTVEHEYQIRSTDVGYSDYYEFKLNETFKLDLNGDGKLEEIVLKSRKEQYSYDLSWLEINGQKIEDMLGNVENVLVMDVDPDDGYLELVVGASRPSAVLDNYYFTYDGKNIISMGNVLGRVNYESYIKDKVIHGVQLSEILGTKHYSRQYELDAEHKLKEIPCEWLKINVALMAKVDVPIYDVKTEKPTTKICKKGTTLTAVETDLNKWVKVKLEDGSEGWLNKADIVDENFEPNFIGVQFSS